MKLTIVDCSSCGRVHADIDVVKLVTRSDVDGRKYDYRATCSTTGVYVFIRYGEPEGEKDETQRFD